MSAEERLKGRSREREREEGVADGNWKWGGHWAGWLGRRVGWEPVGGAVEVIQVGLEDVDSGFDCWAAGRRTKGV